jgi:SAM-dependent methyltransferase
MEPCRHPRSAARLLFPARDWVTGDAFEVCHCPGCGLAVTLPQPDREALAYGYPPGYHRGPAGRRFPRGVEWLQRLLYARRARAVERLVGGRTGRVLDVGCGPGFLLDAFRRRGWEPQGTELTEGAAAHARRVLGIPVHVGPLESWPWPESSFDAVAMWHVLEHWPDPRVALDRAARLLRPGGVLLVGVPDFGSPEARWAAGAWFHLDVPRHLVHLTRRSLAGMLAGAGLEVRQVVTTAPEYDGFSLLQSALNRLGLGHNLLYDLLRRRGARLSRERASRLDLALTLLLTLPLGLLALPAAALLSLTGRGSSVTLLAARAPSPGPGEPDPGSRPGPAEGTPGTAPAPPGAAPAAPGAPPG